jgi:hypothetical protein
MKQQVSMSLKLADSHHYPNCVDTGRTMREAKDLSVGRTQHQNYYVLVNKPHCPPLLPGLYHPGFFRFTEALLIRQMDKKEPRPSWPGFFFASRKRR